MNAHAHHLTRTQVVALLEERDELREAVRQLQEMLAPTVAVPRSWRLTLTEEKLLLAFRGVGSNVLHRERAMIAMYGLIDADTPDVKICDVYVCKLRRKLMEAQTRITIHTSWGRGWYLDVESLRRLNEAVAGERAAADAAQLSGLDLRAERAA